MIEIYKKSYKDITLFSYMFIILVWAFIILGYIEQDYFWLFLASAMLVQLFFINKKLKETKKKIKIMMIEELLG